MLSMHINTGAPFQRGDGTRWLRGEKYVPSENELAQRAYKLLPVEDIDAPPPANAGGGDDGEGGWTLPMDPQKYLRLHPNGPYADLARAQPDNTPDNTEGSEDGKTD